MTESYKKPTILARITFLSASKGGRKNLPQPPWGTDVGYYMPHLVVDGSQEYLGVKFVDGPTPQPDLPGEFRLELFYEGVDYSPLKLATTFTVREGKNVVAIGEVLSVK